MEIAYKVASSLVTPPGIIILFALLGLLIHIKKPWLGATVLGASVLLLLALSLPLTANELMTRLQRYPALDLNQLDRKAADFPQAIVVLGGGRNARAPEYGGDTVSSYTLERLRYASVLHKHTGLPVLVSGGAPLGEEVSEAALMRDALVHSFHTPVKWMEPRSRNTIENARYSAELLQTAGIKRVFLVTHAWHMRRALHAFDKQGLRATPAPTGFFRLSKNDATLLGYLPSAHALRSTSLAVHEYVGFYRSPAAPAAPVSAPAAPSR